MHHLVHVRSHVCASLCAWETFCVFTGAGIEMFIIMPLAGVPSLNAGPCAGRGHAGSKPSFPVSTLIYSTHWA